MHCLRRFIEHTASALSRVEQTHAVFVAVIPASCDCFCGTARNENLSAFWTYPCVDSNALGYDLFSLAVGFSLIPADVLLFMTSYGSAGSFGVYPCGSLERYARIVGTVLILPVLAGLALKGVEAAFPVRLV